MCEKINGLQSNVDDIKKAYEECNRTMKNSAIAAIVLVIAMFISLGIGVKFSLGYEEYVQQYAEQTQYTTEDDKNENKEPFNSDAGKPMAYAFLGSALITVLCVFAIISYYTALRQRGRCMEMLNEHRKYLEKLHTISHIESDGEKHRLYAKLIEK